MKTDLLEQRGAAPLAARVCLLNTRPPLLARRLAAALALARVWYGAAPSRGRAGGEELQHACGRAIGARGGECRTELVRVVVRLWIRGGTTEDGIGSRRSECTFE